ncbi:MAG: CotH kinase family protein [Eubacteriales bacterium]|nr:CotH kinase family protein [Eubacteriales bacterium]
MSKKPVYKRRQPFRASEHLGLITLVIFAFVLLIVLFFFFGKNWIPDDMNPKPSWTSETDAETDESQMEISDMPIVDNPILITEIQSSNRSTLLVSDQSAPDWIELYNSGSSPVNLEGYALSDNLKKPNSFVFGPLTINPQAYLVVYSSGLSGQDALQRAQNHQEIHLPFRLAQSGENLLFTDPRGQVLARLELPEIPSDLSWGLLDDARSATDPYYFFSMPTPMNANGSDGHQDAADALIRPDSQLLINEYVTQQNQYTDRDGDTPDWVEFFNAGTEPVNLQGLFFSDNLDDREKWVFPNITLDPQDYLLVYLSGKTVAYDPLDPTTLHAPFRLGPGDEHLVITDPAGRALIIEPLVQLPLNVSYGRSLDDPDTLLYYPKPTPGRPNETQGFASIDGAMTLKGRQFWINEVVAMGSVVTLAGKESLPDWIELYNGTDSPIDLTGFGLSDSRDQPFLEQLDGIILPPDGYAVIEPTSFSIGASGETLYLTDPDGWIHDSFETGYQMSGVSSGRLSPDHPADQRFFFETPTPGSLNHAEAFEGVALQPLIHIRSARNNERLSQLYIEEAVLVSLESPQPKAVIRYTLDGSEPTRQSAIFEEPFVIDKSTVIRCRAYVPSSLPSREISQTLLREPPHDLPVVSLIGDNAHFFDPVEGIWTHYEAFIEQPVRVEFYETDGTSGVQFASGIELHGSYSRTEEQKSMELKIRTAYGDSQVTYPFFPDNAVDSYKRLILRTSGQDWRYSKMRDIFMTEVIKDVTAQDTMAWRPCVVYINGRYFGLYNLREKVDQYYAASHHGADPDNIDMIKGNKIILNGDDEAYQTLLNYVKSHDMRDPEAYQTVLSQIDEESLMDFVITQTFFNNLDSGNKKFWRERRDGSEWRWVFFDLDWAMFPSTYTINILKYDLLDPNGHGQQNLFDSTLQVKLMENPEFKEAFIQRYAWYLNTVFETERMLGILDNITETIRGEMPRHIDRWGRPLSMPYWENQVSELRRIVSEKRERMIVILQESFALSNERIQTLFPED